VVALPHAADRRLETITNAMCGVFYARFVARAELLHIQGIGASIILPIAKLLRMRVIVTYHSKNYEHAKWNWIARAFLRSGELFALRFSDHVVTVSKSVERELIDRFPMMAYKVQFIPNGADHFCSAPGSHSPDDQLRKYGLKKGRYVVAVGRLVPEKGFHDLLEAFDAMDASDCKLVLVGEADHQDGYSKGLRARASDRIVFTGFLPQGCIHALLRDASLFVLPSYNEGMPIAALEAVMAGCPVLLSNIEPNRALGFAPKNYFAVGSVESLRDKLAGDHSAYRVDRSSILETYNWKRASAEMNKLYASIEEKLRAKHGPPGAWKLRFLVSRTARLRRKAGVDAQRAIGCEPFDHARREEGTRH
jgi:glycosyltransferase involved in cell wall biosynthesis